MAKARISISFCAAFSIVLVVMVACLFVLLRRDETSTETVAETTENSQEPEVKPQGNNSFTVNSSSTIEPHSAHKRHHRHHKQFCRKCCHTPPCWYNNHKECSKCVKKEQLKHSVERILRRSHKKATHHHRTQKNASKK
ncbi:uncharacterized protein LOC110045051 [Orbicella faveolata]|uniref:uncharacterized protein LOC110045051 n=1 Tax=Orbicella faveolata TaxID=48498 RepID=UPI0009E2B119|nr:uncharacterized protein LOC110045051 [Orbicella faveolata]